MQHQKLLFNIRKVQEKKHVMAKLRNYKTLRIIRIIKIPNAKAENEIKQQRNLVDNVFI